MANNLKIGIIGGTGWMGKIMGEALLAKNLIEPKQLWVSNHSGQNNYHAPIHFTTDSQELIDAVDIVILAVRPQLFPTLALRASNQLVISIMAKVSIADIESHTQAKRVIRSMPNAAIPEGLSYTPWYANTQVTEQDKKNAIEIFNCFGSQDLVAKEDDINFMTALTGCSHGWLAYVAESLIECGIRYGLDPNLAEHAVREAMKGMGQLIANEKPSPTETLKKLKSYGGLTITEAGLASFDKDNMSEIIACAIEKAYRRASGKE